MQKFRPSACAFSMVKPLSAASLGSKLMIGTNDEQGLGWDRVCEAQRSNESPSGAFKRQSGLRKQMEGLCPDKLHRLFRTPKL